MPGHGFNTRHALAVLAVLSVLAQPSASGPTEQPAAVLQTKGALSYNVEWRLIDAGKAKLTWNARTQASHPGWQLKLHLESAGLVSKLYKVDDDYEADL